jgi:diguanylate cyclase (GGDEF)-like protein/PAS domain S-box-containing protein
MDAPSDKSAGSTPTSAEERLRKLTRAHSILVECGRVLVRSTDERQLFDEVCEIISGPAGYHGCWIGLAENDADKTIRPVASGGRSKDAIRQVKLSWGNNEYGNGPAGRAIRTGSAQLVSDAARDASWRKELTLRSIRSALALPIRESGRVIGVLTIVSAETDTFDGEEVDMLHRLVADISYGVAALRSREARRNAEKRVTESEQRFRAVFNLAPVGINHIAPDGRLLLVNPAFEKLLGYERGELTGRSIREFTPEEDGESLAQLLQMREQLHAGRIQSFSRTHRYRRKNGSFVWVGLTVAAIRDPAGNVLYDITAVEDITERVRSERLQALEHAVARTIASAEHQKDAITDILKALCEADGWDCGRYFRRDSERMLHLTAWWHVPNDQLAAAISRSVAAGGTPMRGLITLADESGEPVWSSDASQDPRVHEGTMARQAGTHGTLVFPVTANEVMIGVIALSSFERKECDARLLQAVRSIGSQIGQYLQRKAAEAALRYSEARFRGLTELSTDWYWEQDSEARITAVSGRGRQPRLDVIGRRRWELPGNRTSEEEWERHRRTIAARQPFLDFLHEFEDAKGEQHCYAISGEPVFDEQGEFTGYRGTAKDITEARRREDELRRFRTAMDLSFDSITLVDRTTMRIIDANRTAYTQVGCTREELLETPPWVLSDRSREEQEAIYDDLIAGRIASGPFVGTRRRRNGSTYQVEVYRHAVPIRDGHLIVVILRDITYRWRAEKLRNLEHSVARSLAEASDASEALRGVLQAVCESEGWDFGRFFAVDESARVLRFTECWCTPGQGLETFIEQTRGLTYAPGIGLAGLTWLSGEPIWVADIGRDARPQSRNWVDAGIRGAFLFAAVAEGRTLGVLAFSSRQIREPDEHLLGAVRAIGIQLGQFLQRKSAEEALRRSDERFNTAVDATSDVIWDWDLRTGQLWWNENLTKVFGYRRDEIDPTIAFWHDAIHPDDRDATTQAVQQVIDSGGSDWSGEYRLRTIGGRYAHVFDRGHVLRDASGRAVRMVGALEDITARKEAESRIQLQAHRQQVIAQFSQDTLASEELGLVLQQAVDTVAATLNADCSDVTHLDREHWQLTCLAAKGWPENWPGFGTVQVLPGGPIESVFERSEPLVIDNYPGDPAFAKSLPARWGIRSGMMMRINAPSGSFVLGVHCREPRRFTEDDTSFLRSIANVLAVAIERSRVAGRLAHLAQYDALTGLPNRHLFQDRLSQALAQAKRNSSSMAVLFIDLDRFKLVNDTLGHASGDMLLKEAASRLQKAVRASDTVGRLGGDEFSAILLGLDKANYAGLVAQKIIDAVGRPYSIGGNEVYVSASVGITLYPTDGEDPGALLVNADAAMYRAKDEGRNNFQYFTREMNVRATQRMQLESQLRHALERHEFSVYYQPRVELAGGSISGLEALLRWNHPERGLVLPAEIIPLLEETGLIVPVGEWVLRECCRQVSRWRESGLEPPPVAVNLSVRQFQQKDLERAVIRILREAKMAPGAIEFEITESLLMLDPESAERTLNGLSASGVKLSVDDFGTGYSSLAYLKRFPLDALKIDRAFVRDLVDDPEDEAITLAIISLAHSLQLRVIAEGVETEQQLAFLRRNGCDEIQGFYFSHALPAAACGELLASGAKLGDRVLAAKAG